MPESSEPRQKPSDITRLLLKAVKSLPEHEQAAVFAYFFERGIGGPVAGTQMRMPFVPPSLSEWPGSAATVVRAQKSSGPPQQVIPVRLSEETHRRLKQWSADHDFHMSVV